MLEQAATAGYEVRAPRAGELELVRMLRHQVLDPARNGDFELAMSQRDHDPSTVHMASFVNGAPVSTVRLDQKDGAGTFEVRKMATDKAYQGKGIGAAVLQEAEAEAMRRGARSFMLWARAEAIGFYEKCGYMSTGQQTTHDDGILNFKMTKGVKNGAKA